MNYPMRNTVRTLEWYTLQAKLYLPITKGMLDEAGVGPGMRVLDVGTGAGDMAVLLSKLVGPTGTVLGIDASAEAIDGAKLRVKEKNVQFLQADVNHFASSIRFDAVVGRFVLMYTQAPSLVLKRLAQLVRPSGLIFFLEPDYSGARSSEPCPLSAQVQTVIESVLKRSGADTTMGLKLYRAFTDAGLEDPTVRCSAVVGGGKDFLGYDVVQGFLDLLAPLAEQYGLATIAGARLDSIAEQMRMEVKQSGGVIIFPSLIAAWARLTERESP